MSLLAVTVVGPDRAGIIADVTGVLAAHGGNLEDASMTLLRGHFAMTLVVRPPAPAAEVEAGLAALTADGRLGVSVREVADAEPAPAVGEPWVLTVHGGDRPGIVSAVARLVADAGGNVTDLGTRLAGGLYVLVAEVDLPVGPGAERLPVALAEVAGELGVEASLRPAEPDLL